ncbi:MAG: putative sulfate exporter family transporter, partial [Bacteroidetes bacterium]|nr:putative sulfate exporter family transporter [Bacteroidota bacterium]
AVILFSFIVNKQQSENEGKKFSFKLPTFLWIFIAITILNSLINLSPDILKVLKQVGEILLTVAMAAIGLGVSFKNLWQSGKSAIGFGLIIFLLQIALALLLVLSF